MSQADTPDIPDLGGHDRGEVADDLRQIMAESLRKSSGNGRIRDESKENVRIRYMRAFVKAATEYRQTIDALEAEHAEARITRLEETVEELSGS